MGGFGDDRSSPCYMRVGRGVGAGPGPGPGRGGWGGDPPIVLLYCHLHNAIRWETRALTADVAQLQEAEGGGGTPSGALERLKRRCTFLRDIHGYHCSVEDEIVYPALDKKVKNCASAGYSHEHEDEDLRLLMLLGLVEEQIFRGRPQISILLDKAAEVHTLMMTHLAKEESHLYPLLLKHFSRQEQAELVAQFFCSIPLVQVGRVTAWLAERAGDTLAVQGILEEVCTRLSSEGMLQPLLGLRLLEPAQQEAGAGAGIVGGVQHSSEASGWGVEEGASRADPGAGAGGAGGEVVGPSGRTAAVGAKSPALSADGGSGEGPIALLGYFHTGIEKELDRLVQLTTELIAMSEVPIEGCPTGCPRGHIEDLLGRLRFLSSVCKYHAKSEEDVIFPAVAARGCPTIQEECGHGDDRARERGPFVHMYRVLSEAQSLVRRRVSDNMLKAHLKVLLEGLLEIRDEMVQHMKEEEAALVPRVRMFFRSTQEQSDLMWQSLKSIPLRLLREIFPWLAEKLSTQKVSSMMNLLRLGAPAHELDLIEDLEQCMLELRPSVPNFAAGLKRPLSAEKGTLTPSEREKPAQMLRLGDQSETARHESGDSVQPGAAGNASAGTGIEDTAAGRVRSHERSQEQKSSASPIDLIFRFHDTLRAELKLFISETESFTNHVKESFRGDRRVNIPSLGKLASSLGSLKTRFLYLWGIYSAHSKAEDEIVFPALEAKHMQSGVCQGYSIDHEHEERLFSQLSDVMQKVEQNVEALPRPDDFPSPEDATLDEEKTSTVALVVSQATKLHAMIVAVLSSLEVHVTSEERELWPLFVEHFSVPEQEQIVSQIIGRTGAEVLQQMLTLMVETVEDPTISSIKSTSRNTMFEHWLKSQLGDSYLQTSAGSEVKKSTSSKEKTDGPVPSSTPPKPSARIGGGSSACLQTSQDEGGEDGGFYHPKWEHIFKLNLRELHGHVRMVASDPNVDPRKKRYIMQNLMASRWVLSQKHDTKILHTKALQPGPRNGSDDGEAGPGETVKNKPKAPSHFVSYTPDGRLGCEHYSRGCAFVYPCCNKAYTCRLCHDAASDHEADRKSVKEMICMHCGERQPPEKQCRACKRSLSNYFCKICRFADDDKDNETYHCPYCNVCRRGKGLGIDFYHCMKCNQCISLERSVSHRCREGHAPTEGSCPICFDKLDSTRPLKELPCGHLLHSECFKCHIEHGLYKCPVCSKSIGNMTIFWRMLDAKLAVEKPQMPEEDRTRTSSILCNDCGEKSVAPFHYVYHKCQPCGSYNTKVTK